MTLQVLIVDDEPATGIYLKAIIEQVPGVNVLAVTSSAKKALEEAAKYLPHVVFLDIDMPEMNGLELARTLVKRHDDINIVFATAFPDYALQAFGLYAFDYILKPFNEKRIKNTIKKLIGKMQAQHPAPGELRYVKHIAIDTQAEKIFLNPDEILFIESNRSKLNIKTVRNAYIIKGKLHSLEERLAPYGFFRTHRSYLVNLRHIKEITPSDYTFEIVMLSEDRVLLSRHKEKRLRKRLNQLN